MLIFFAGGGLITGGRSLSVFTKHLCFESKCVVPQGHQGWEKMMKIFGVITRTQTMSLIR